MSFVDQHAIGRDALTKQCAGSSQVGQIDVVSPKRLHQQYQQTVDVESWFGKIRKVPVGPYVLTSPRARAVQHEQAQAGEFGHLRRHQWGERDHHERIVADSLKGPISRAGLRFLTIEDAHGLLARPVHSRDTLIVRGPALSDRSKYWLRPDLENRIKEGSITALFSTVVEEIRDTSLLVRNEEGLREIPNDGVLAMTGYHPDFAFLERIGITLADDGWRAPVV